MKRKDAIGLAAAGLLAGLPAMGRTEAQPPVKTNVIDVGKAFPLLTVVARDGTAYDVPASDGRPTLITMFASWCGPCRLELPFLIGDWHRWNERVFIIGFDLSESDEKAAAYIDLLKIPFPVATLATTDADFFGRFSIPHGILIDKAGIVRDMWEGIDASSGRDPLFGRLAKVGIS